MFNNAPTITRARIFCTRSSLSMFACDIPYSTQSLEFLAEISYGIGHPPRSMRSRVYVTVRCLSVRPSVCPSVCLCRHSPAALRCCRFAAVCPASRRYRSIAARRWARSSTAHGSKCGQWHVVSWRRKLNTDLLLRLQKLTITNIINR